MQTGEYGIVQWECDKAKGTVLCRGNGDSVKRQIRVSRGNDVRYSGFSLEKKRCYVLFTFAGIPMIVFGSLVVAVLAKERCNNLK